MSWPRVDPGGSTLLPACPPAWNNTSSSSVDTPVAFLWGRGWDLNPTLPVAMAPGRKTRSFFPQASYQLDDLGRTGEWPSTLGRSRPGDQSRPLSLHTSGTEPSGAGAGYRPSTVRRSPSCTLFRVGGAHAPTSATRPPFMLRATCSMLPARQFDCGFVTWKVSLRAGSGVGGTGRCRSP